MSFHNIRLFFRQFILAVAQPRNHYPHRKISFLGFRLIAVLSLLLGLLPGAPVALAAPTLNISKIASVTTIPSGQPFTYSFNYRCASITEDCLGTTLTDILPPELSSLASDVSLASSTTDIANFTYTPATRKVLFTFISPLPAGSSGTLTLNVKFPNNTTPNGTVAKNTATMSATNAGSVTSTEVDVTATATSNWTVTKSAPTATMIDGNATYTVQMAPPATGALSLTNASMVDTLPTGAVFVSATSGGVYNATNNTVTWSYAGPITTTQSATVTVVYPSPTFVAGQNVTNKVDAFGQPFGQSSVITVGTASRTHTLTTPTISASRAKTVSSGTIVIGGTGYYDLSAASTATAPIDNFTLEDSTIPSQITLTNFTTGINSTATGVTVSYKTNLNTTYHTTGLANPYAGGSSSTITIASLGLAANEYITGIRWNYGTVPVGFNATSTKPRVNFTLASPDPTGTAVTSGVSVKNCDRAAWSYGGTAGTTTDACASFTTAPSAGGTSGKTAASSTVLIGASSYYDLTGANTGSVPLDNYTIEDATIPSQLTLTTFTTGVNSASNPVTVSYTTNLNATYHSTGLANPYSGSTNNTITISALGLAANEYITGIHWNYGTMPAGFTFSTKPRVNFKLLSPDPTGAVVNASTVIKNCSRVNWDVSGTPGNTSDSCASFTSAPSTNVTGSKTVGSATTLIGGTSYYDLSATNGSSVSVDNFTLEDGNIPGPITLTNFTTGKNSASSVVVLSYKTNLNPAYHSTGLAASYAGGTNTTITIASLGLAANEYITGIRWNYGTVPSGFTTSTKPRINFSVLSPDPTGATINNGTSINNCSKVTWDYAGTPGNTADYCAAFTANSTTAQPTPAKSVQTTTPAGGFLPGQQVTYRLKVGNNAASSASLNDPILMDLLPASLSFVSTPAPGYTVTNGAGGLAVTGTLTPTSFENLPNYNGTGRTLLRWKWSGLSVAAGKEFYVDFVVQINTGTTNGNISNTEALASDVSLTNCTIADTNDLTGDGSSTDKRCEATDNSLAVGSVATLSSQKLVKGQLDSGYSLAGWTIPGGTADYKLTVTNTGNIPVKNIEVIDILPFIGDTGVIDPQARLSEWRPNLIGAVSAPAGVTVYYSTQTNPCRPELVPGGPAGCTAAGWTTALPADPSTVQALKFDFGSIILNPAGSLTLGWPMRAPVGTQPGKLAWNSFGYVGTRTDNDVTLLPSEPIKVNIQVQASSAASYGDYVWIDTNHNGVQDSGEVGLNGVKVDLYQPGADGVAGTGDDVLIGSTLTVNDVNGNPGSYLFPGLPAGQYFAKFTLPAGYVFSPKNQGGDAAKDSDPDTATGITAITNLAVGQNDLTWDAGIYQPPAPASLGDFVWYDTNRNGIQDGGETGVQGVTVTLYNSSGTSIATTTTDPNGKYSFTNLAAGTYSVGFSNLPSGYVFSPAIQGSDPAKDSDADAITGKTGTVTLAPGDNNLTLDAGINQPVVPLASLGDFVWLDNDRNGIQDTGENGVQGVTVTLYDAATSTQLATTTTDINGKYGFTNLNPGSYYVVFTPPAGYGVTLQNQGSDTAKDSNPIPTTGANYGKTANVTLVAGQNDPTIDAGLFQLASLGDFVWYDTNRDGIQDASETGVQGVTVTLYDSGGTPVGSPATTDANGKYSFTNLIPGTYSVGFSNLPAGYVFSPKLQGSDTAKDSDADTVSGKTATVTLAPGDNNLTLDAGINQPIAPKASLGDFVWLDNDRNGIQNGGEPGVQGVTVTLYDATTSTQVGSPATTDANGKYSFTNLNPGSYYVVFSPPVSYALTLQNQGSDPTVDSNANPAAGATYGKTATVTLVAGQNDPTIDAGVYQLAALGDFVWYDTNRDGIQDAGETGVQGVTVTLYDNGGTSVSTTTTDSNGKYSFTNLIPGTYSVGFSNLPSGYVFSPKLQGGDTAKDSDADTTTGKTVPVTLAPGDNNITLDAGINQPLALASLGDFVWLDNNRNGIQDSGELGVQGVTVKLYDATNNTQLNTTTTDSNGKYGFTNLNPGSYYVVFVSPTGYAITLQNQGSDTAKDSNANPTAGANYGKTANVTLVAGQNDPTIDAGLFQLAALGDFVWYDTNRNGIQDSSELGVQGVTVTLYDNAGSPVGSPTTTDSNGKYSFTNLIPGTYSVGFSNLPSGYIFSPKLQGSDTAKDSDADTTTGKTATVTLAPGDNNITLDAGINQPPALASLGDFVWYDTNRDGIQDASETGVQGVTVTLYDSTGTPIGSPATTDANGKYSFTNLVPGTYSVGFSNLPSGYVFSPKLQGSDPAKDSDADTVSGKTGTVTLAAGDNNITLDAGINQPVAPKASLGDFVWLDNNRNGIQDAGELGVQGVTVKLYDATTSTQLSTTSTDANGKYGFTNLNPGSYYVVFVPPTGYAVTLQNQGSDTAVDSNANPTAGTNYGKTANVTLVAGQNDPTIDAGLFQLASLGDFVWYDTNHNGIQDSGETGVQGVTVTLYDNSSNPVGSPATTDSNGKYSFTNLVPGVYSVGFSNLPSGYVFSPKLQGSDPAKDSDADPANGKTGTVTLAAGDNNLTLDAGIHQSTTTPTTTATTTATVTGTPSVTTTATTTATATGTPSVTATTTSTATSTKTPVGTPPVTTTGTPSGTPTVTGTVTGTATPDGTPGVTTTPPGTVTATPSPGSTPPVSSTTPPAAVTTGVPATTVSGTATPVTSPGATTPAGTGTPATTATPTPGDPGGTPTTENGGKNTPTPGTGGTDTGGGSGSGGNSGTGGTNPSSGSTPAGTGSGSTGSSGSQGSGTGTGNDPSTGGDPGNSPNSGSGATGTPKTPARIHTEPYLTKQVDSQAVVAGQVVKYTIVVTNPSDLPAEKVVISDPVPDMLVVQDASSSQGKVSRAGQIVTAEVGTVAPGASVTIIVTTKVASGIAGKFTNIATMTGEKGGIPFSSNGAMSAEDTSAGADLVVVPNVPHTGLGQTQPLDQLAGSDHSMMVLFAYLILSALLLGGIGGLLVIKNRRGN